MWHSWKYGHETPIVISLNDIWITFIRLVFQWSLKNYKPNPSPHMDNYLPLVNEEA
jgi:hypothetical protein